MFPSNATLQCIVIGRMIQYLDEDDRSMKILKIENAPNRLFNFSQFLCSWSFGQFITFWRTLYDTEPVVMPLVVVILQVSRSPTKVSRSPTNVFPVANQHISKLIYTKNKTSWKFPLYSQHYGEPSSSGPGHPRSAWQTLGRLDRSWGGDWKNTTHNAYIYLYIHFCSFKILSDWT